MNCDSCNCNPNFAPIQDTWTSRSSLTNSSWQPFPELNAPSTKENYDYATNTCNSQAIGPPLTNGYTFSNRQLPKKEAYEHCFQPLGRYKKIDTTWDVQKPYTL